MINVCLIPLSGREPIFDEEYAGRKISRGEMNFPGVILEAGLVKSTANGVL